MPSRSLPPASFTAKERDLIRREFSQFFGTLPSLADGMLLRTWRAGDRKGEPKIPPALQSMLDRGLVGVRPVQHGFLHRGGPSGAAPPAARSTRHGSGQVQHLRQELEIDPGPPAPAPQ